MIFNGSLNAKFSDLFVIGLLNLIEMLWFYRNLIRFSLSIKFVTGRLQKTQFAK